LIVTSQSSLSPTLFHKKRCNRIAAFSSLVISCGI
jgi:hypothetical protein